MGRGGLSAPRRGAWRGRLLASGAALLLALLALEVLARLRFGAPLAERLPIVLIQADEATGWRMVPSQEHYTYLHHVRVNALGLRGAEVLQKAPGERRVLALGDSLIYGQGVAEEETVTAHLQAMLEVRAEPGTSWSVVNAGHRAYDTRQELALLEDLGAKIEPDVVVLFWFWNDVRERDIPSTCARLTASGPVTFDTGQAMEGWPRLRWHLLQLARRSALVMTAHDLLRARKAGPVPPEVIDEAMGRLDGYLARFQELARAQGFELLFAAVPDANALLQPHPSEDIRARAEAVAAARALAPCDLLRELAALVAAEGALPVLPYDGHYTGAANRALAAGVARCLDGK